MTERDRITQIAAWAVPALGGLEASEIADALLAAGIGDTTQAYERGAADERRYSQDVADAVAAERERIRNEIRDRLGGERHLRDLAEIHADPVAAVVHAAAADAFAGLLAVVDAATSKEER